MKKQLHNQIDQLLQIRKDGMYAYSKATTKLIELGVKIGRKSDGALTIPASFQPHLEQYENSNMEFEWEAEYTDGKKVKQFEAGVQHHLGDIDQSKLTSLAWISNFTWATDNNEKRVIVKLNWENGIFEIMNGFPNQETREFASMNPLAGEKKLILFTNKQFSETIGDVPDRYKEFFPLMEEFFYYNLFIIGYQIKGTDKKKMLMIQPNGNITIFKN